eukprot:Sspe_Gene.9042::Locus_3044_Transcript_1_2_Confidence_0.667_Length_1551::g.9042::m.9042
MPRQPDDDGSLESAMNMLGQGIDNLLSMVDRGLHGQPLETPRPAEQAPVADQPTAGHNNTASHVDPSKGEARKKVGSRFGANRGKNVFERLQTGSGLSGEHSNSFSPSARKNGYKVSTVQRSQSADPQPRRTPEERRKKLSDAAAPPAYDDVVGRAKDRKLSDYVPSPSNNIRRHTGASPSLPKRNGLGARPVPPPPKKPSANPKSPKSSAATAPATKHTKQKGQRTAARRGASPPTSPKKRVSSVPSAEALDCLFDPLDTTPDSSLASTSPPKPSILAARRLSDTATAYAAAACEAAKRQSESDLEGSKSFNSAGTAPMSASQTLGGGTKQTEDSDSVLDASTASKKASLAFTTSSSATEGSEEPLIKPPPTRTSPPMGPKKAAPKIPVLSLGGVIEKKQSDPSYTYEKFLMLTTGEKDIRAMHEIHF